MPSAIVCGAGAAGLAAAAMLRRAGVDALVAERSEGSDGDDVLLADGTRVTRRARSPAR